jgi:hypothetical protein
VGFWVLGFVKKKKKRRKKKRNEIDLCELQDLVSSDILVACVDDTVNFVAVVTLEGGNGSPKHPLTSSTRITI